MYVRGWYVTFILSVLSLNQCAVWFTFACVDPDVLTNSINGMTSDIIRWSLILGPIGYFVSLPFTTALATYGKHGGINRCIQIGAVSVLVSSGLLVVSALDGVRSTAAAVPLAYFALLINAMMGPTVLSLPAPLAADYFPPDKQGTPVAVALAANGLGVVLWYPLGPAIASEPNQVANIMWVRLACAAVGALLVIKIPSGDRKDPFHSSLEATIQGNHDNHNNNEDVITEPWTQVVSQQMKGMLALPQQNSKAYYAIAVGAATQVGIVSAFGTFVQNILQNRYSPEFLGWLGFSMTIAAVPGGILGGVFSDFVSPRNLQLVVYGWYFLELIIIVIASGILGFGEDHVPWIQNTPKWLLVLVMSGLGFVQQGTNTLALLRALALCPSLPEAITGAWTSTMFNVGYVMLLVVPTTLLSSYGIIIELVAITLQILVMMVWVPLH
eukprot:PhF_6_TR32165/c0_g1_i5/m.47719